MSATPAKDSPTINTQEGADGEPSEEEIAQRFSTFDEEGSGNIPCSSLGGEGRHSLLLSCKFSYSCALQIEFPWVGKEHLPPPECSRLHCFNSRP